MSPARLLVGTDVLRQKFVNLCEWAEEIALVTPRFDGSSWAIGTLERVRQKIEHVLLPERSSDAAAHALLHDASVLRWVSASPSGFGAAMYLFRRESAVAVLLGGPHLGGSAEVMVEVAALFEGTRDDEWSCAAHDAIDELRSRARVPVGTDLADVALGGSIVETTPELLSDAGLGKLLLLTEAQDIRDARDRFVNGFRAGAHPFTRPFPLREGIADPNLHWHSQYRIWGTFALGASRYVKSFGNAAPDATAPVSPLFEINVPIAGIDRRCVGAFAREVETSRIFLIHRGRIGRGVAGTQSFWNATRLRGVLLDEGSDADPTKVALVAELGSPRLAEQVAAFLREVIRLGSDEEVEGEGSDWEAETGVVPFEQLDAEHRIEALHQCLIGTGPLEKDAAIRLAAQLLRESGVVEYQRLDPRGGLYEALQRAVEAGVAAGSFDRPGRGRVRAICADPIDVPMAVWEEALRFVLQTKPLDREDVIRFTFDVARERFLDVQRLRSGGRAETAIKSAIRRAVRRGILEASGRMLALTANA